MRKPVLWRKQNTPAESRLTCTLVAFYIQWQEASSFVLPSSFFFFVPPLPHILFPYSLQTLPSRQFLLFFSRFSLPCTRSFLTRSDLHALSLSDVAQHARSHSPRLFLLPSLSSQLRDALVPIRPLFSSPDSFSFFTYTPLSRRPLQWLPP